MGCQLTRFGRRPGQSTFQSKPKQRGWGKEKTKCMSHSSLGRQLQGEQSLLSTGFNHWSWITPHTAPERQRMGSVLGSDSNFKQVTSKWLGAVEKTTVIYIFYIKGTYLKWIFILTGNNTITFYNFYTFNPWNIHRSFSVLFL